MSINEVVEDMFSGDELYTREYFSQGDICRLCWSKNARHDFVTEVDTKMNVNERKQKNQLVYKVQDCLNIDLSTLEYEDFPNKLCEACFSKVEHFSLFKSCCQEFDKRLHAIFSHGTAENYEPSSEFVKIENGDEMANIDASKSDSLDVFLDSLDPSETSLQEPLEICTDSLEYNKNKNREPLSTAKKKSSTTYKRKRGSSYCNICHANFNDKDSLDTHNSEAHGIEVTGLFKCFGCEKRFKTRGNRLCHELGFCKQLKDGYKCNICNRFLPKRRMYEVHIRGHKMNQPVDLPEDIFQCAKCMKKFTSKRVLSFHLKSHEMEHNFVCETCGRVFLRLDYLNKHVAIHTGLRRYQCPHCPYRSTQPSSLTVHIRKHTGERPYPCDLCPQKCISSSNLRAHRKRHLAVQDYQCSICPKKFGYKTSLEDHIAATHERARRYNCDTCGASYTRRRGLRRHQQTKHGAEPRLSGRETQIAPTELNATEKTNKTDIVADLMLS